MAISITVGTAATDNGTPTTTGAVTVPSGTGRKWAFLMLHGDATSDSVAVTTSGWTLSSTNSLGTGGASQGTLFYKSWCGLQVLKRLIL